MSFLVDTDTCSAYIKGVPRVINRFLQYSAGLHVSTVTGLTVVDWMVP